MIVCCRNSYHGIISQIIILYNFPSIYIIFIIRCENSTIELCKMNKVETVVIKGTAAICVNVRRLLQDLFSHTRHRERINSIGILGRRRILRPRCSRYEISPHCKACCFIFWRTILWCPQNTTRSFKRITTKRLCCKQQRIIFPNVVRRNRKFLTFFHHFGKLFTSLSFKPGLRVQSSFNGQCGHKTDH